MFWARLILALLLPSMAWAQTSPGFQDNKKLFAAQLNAAFTAKQDYPPPVFTSGTAGVVPASGGGTSNFLRSDGIFAPPPGGSVTITAGSTPASGFTSGDLISVSSNLVQDSGIAASNVDLLNGNQTISGNKNFTGTFQINSNTITWPAAAISVARIDAAQTFIGAQTIGNGVAGSISLSPGTGASSSLETYNLTNDLSNAVFAATQNNSATANTTLINIPNSAVLRSLGAGSAGLFIGASAASTGITFFTGGTATTNKRGQIGSTGGWCIGNCTADAGSGAITFNPQAFGSLPSCVAGLEGAVAEVNDSTANTFGATISGSGSNKVLAHCNGTNWTVAGI